MPAYSRILLPWDSQPQEPAQINADSWQSQGLLQWHPFNGNALEPVSGAVSSLESGAAFAVGQRGFHAAFDGTNDYIQTSRPIVIGNAFTFSFWFYRTTNNTRQTVFGCENAAGVIQIEVGQRATAGAGQGAVCALYSGVGVLDSANDVWAANVWNHVVVTGTVGGVGNRKIYVNGGEVGLSYDGGQGFTATSIARTFGRRSSGSQQFAGQLQDCRIYDYGMSAEQALRLYRDGLELFAPRTIWVPVSAGGGGGVNLVIADSAHAHAADNIGLTLDTYLAVNEALHAHTADNLTLSTTGSTDLTVADSAHAQALDNVVLTSQAYLAVADMLHAHALDGVTLTLGGASLTVAELLHAHALDNTTLTLDTYLAVADALHVHTLDNVVLSTPGGTLDLILKILANRQELNPTTGTFTLYDDDGTTVLYTTNAWADAAGTAPYSGGALRRIDALF